jgi:uncharacterized protein (TIGR03067 family)
MHFTAFLVGAAVLATFAGLTPAQDKKQDTKPADKETEAAARAEELKVLKGTWNIVLVEVSGERIRKTEIGIDRVVITDDRMTAKAGDLDVEVYALELYPGDKPKRMLWKKVPPKEDKREGVTLPVVYEIEGDRLKLCYPLPLKAGLKEGLKPPENFDTKGKPIMLLVVEREKSKP